MSEDRLITWSANADINLLTYSGRLAVLKESQPESFLKFDKSSIDLAAGDRKEHWLPNAITTDMFDYGVDLVFDLCDTPWGIADNQFEFCRAQHIVEHIKDGQHFINILNEVYRICKDGARFYMVCPHWTSPNFFRDPFHYRPISENSLDAFLEGSAIHFGPGYDVHCKFRRVNIWVDSNRDVHFDLRVVK